jgi:hypothetical protein
MATQGEGKASNREETQRETGREEQEVFRNRQLKLQQQLFLRFRQ